MKRLSLSLAVFLLFATFVFAQEPPELQNQYSIGGWPNCAVVQGDVAYLAQSFHIAVLDISGEEMVKIGEFDLPNEPNMMFIQDNYLFAFYQWSDSSLQVFEVSDSFTVESLGRYDLPSEWPQRVSTSGDLFYHASKDTVTSLIISICSNALSMVAAFALCGIATGVV